MEGPVDLGEVADVQPVYQGKVYGGISDVEMTLQVAGIFHGQQYIFFGEIVLAEDVEPELLEIAIEAGTDLGYLAFDYTSERKCE